MPKVIWVIGVLGKQGLDEQAKEILQQADLVVGGTRQLADWGPFENQLEIGSNLDETFQKLKTYTGLVCILASGDPGFFGILRQLKLNFTNTEIKTVTSPSSISVAFARLAIPWDDAVIISAHGRPLDQAIKIAIRSPKVAILTSPKNSPQAIGKQLIALGKVPQQIFVCSNLGYEQEQINQIDLNELATRHWEPLSVVIILGLSYKDEEDKSNYIQSINTNFDNPKPLSWGLDQNQFEFRNQMITKSEIRAIAIAKLGLPKEGVMWDIGSGSGSIAIECSLLRPNLEIFAIEKNSDDVSRIRRNAKKHNVEITILEAKAPEIFPSLKLPDCIFIGGGGIKVLESSLGYLKKGGSLVATYTSIDSALKAYQLLGSMIQVQIATTTPIQLSSMRFRANDPVFLAWNNPRK